MDDISLTYAKTFAKLIQKETVSTFNQTDLKKFYEFHDLLKETFPTLFSVCEFKEFDGSILLKWKGKNSDKPVMLMNHFDVVEAEGDWKIPPFSAEIKDGKLWGRGTLDTKGGLFCMLQAGEELAKQNFIPNQDIYFESACTEECDGSGMVKINEYLASQNLHFDFTLDEGGMIMDNPLGFASGDFAMVGVGEKGCLGLKFIAKSNGGHASAPTKNTPLVRLGKFMAKVEKSKIFTVKLNDVTKQMFKVASVRCKGVLKVLFKHPTFFSPLLKAVLPNFSANANAMMKTTIAFTQAGGSDTFNSLPTEAYIGANMRISHHQGEKASIDAITKIAEKYDIETVITDPAQTSNVADIYGTQYALLKKTIEGTFKDTLVAPYITNTASDSRFNSNLSNNCFRFTPFKITDEQLSSIHGIDENIDICSLSPAVEFYKTLMKEI